MIRLETLGTARVEGVPEQAARRLLAQPKRWALLSYLAVEATDAAVTRDQVLGVFWPEHDQRHARGSLRNALHHLRSILGRDTIASVGDHLSLSSEVVWCDATALLAESDDAVTLLELYGGDFLDGVHVAEAPEFGYWMDRVRSSLRARAAGLAWLLADRSVEAEEWITAAALGRRAVTLAIDIEAASQRLIRMLDAAGDRAAALAEYARLRRALEESYGVEPSPESEALVAEVRARKEPALRSPPPRPPWSGTCGRRWRCSRSAT